MSRNSNLLISAIVTLIISILFTVFVFKHMNFALSDEYQLIPDGIILPKGCDVKIDMQTGETFAKLPKRKEEGEEVSKSLVISEEDRKEEKTKAYPEYKNVTKSRIQSRISSEQMNQIDSALLNLESSWEYLAEEAAAMEIGLAILESKHFPELLKYFVIPNEHALKIVANCLQNNPLAIEKFLELKIHSKELAEIFKIEKMSKNSFKKLLRIVESVMTQYDFIKESKNDIYRHFQEHQDEELKERYNWFY